MKHLTKNREFIVDIQRKRVGKRVKIVLVVLTIWLLCCMAMLFNIAAFQRGTYIEKSNLIAVRQFFVLPQRGTIMDKHEIPLAWSTLHYDLLIDATKAENPEELTAIMDSIVSIVPDANTMFTNDDPVDGKFVIYRDLNAAQVEKFAKEVLPKFAALSIAPRTERIVFENPVVKRIIGDLELKNGVNIGTSGIEKQYNKQLSGTALIYEIMIDKKGKKILSSYRELQNLKLGKDVILPYSVSDIVASETRRISQQSNENRETK